MVAVFFLCFVLSEMLITHFVAEHVLKRFILRIAFLVQYSIFISYLFHIDNNSD